MFVLFDFSLFQTLTGMVAIERSFIRKNNNIKMSMIKVLEPEARAYQKSTDIYLCVYTFG